jgi:4-hydroxy-tetrahydrodipicolinate synthase
VDRARGIPIIVGAGSNDTARTIRWCKMAEECGADGVLVVTPYYNRPPQEGLYRHFMEVADAGALPVVLYNVPTRTGVDLLPETVERLAKHERIVAIKEAKSDEARFRRLLEIPNLRVLSGDDSATLRLRESGGHGVVSVAGNVVPEAMNLLARGDLSQARAMHETLRPLFEALSAETNPIPVKAALAMLGRMTDEVRLPLVPASAETRCRIRAALASLGIEPQA